MRERDEPRLTAYVGRGVVSRVEAFGWVFYRLSPFSLFSQLGVFACGGQLAMRFVSLRSQALGLSSHWKMVSWGGSSKLGRGLVWSQLRCGNKVFIVELTDRWVWHPWSSRKKWRPYVRLWMPCVFLGGVCLRVGLIRAMIEPFGKCEFRIHKLVKCPPMLKRHKDFGVRQ